MQTWDMSLSHRHIDLTCPTMPRDRRCRRLHVVIGMLLLLHAVVWGVVSHSPPVPAASPPGDVRLPTADAVLAATDNVERRLHTTRQIPIHLTTDTSHGRHCC